MLFLFPLCSYYTHTHTHQKKKKTLGKFIGLFVLALTFFTIKDVHLLFFSAHLHTAFKYAK